MVNFGPLTAEIGSGVWGTPTNLNGFCVLAALLPGHLVVGVSQTLGCWTEGATYIRQGGHHVGHWPTFLVTFVACVCVCVWQPTGQECLRGSVRWLEQVMLYCKLHVVWCGWFCSRKSSSFDQCKLADSCNVPRWGDSDVEVVFQMLLTLYSDTGAASVDVPTNKQQLTNQHCADWSVADINSNSWYQ